MKKPVRTVLAQIAPTLGDLDRNLKMHLDEIRRAARAGADLIVFPELSLTGYLLQDLVSEAAQDPADSPLLRRLEKASRDIAIVAGFIEKGPGSTLYNAAACYMSGKLAHLHRKVYLPTYGMFDEGRYVGAGEIFRSFEAPWGRTGILICEDFWHLSSSWLLALEGMEVLIVVSNGPVRGVPRGTGPATLSSWQLLGEVVSRFLTCFVVYVNRAGYEEGWSYGGGSFAVAPTGALLARAKPLRADRVAVRLDPAAIQRARTACPLLRDEKLDLVRRELERIAAARHGLG